MKQLLTIFMALSSLFIYGQNQSDAELDKFMKFGGNYISLTETDNLNDTIKNCIPAIENYLKESNEKLENYYTDDSFLRVENGSVFIPLWHINGFKKVLDLKKEDDKRNDGGSVQITGNVSGKDGNIEVDLTTLKFKEFLYWQ
jgi:hypothetical protein